MARRNYNVEEMPAFTGGIDLDSNPFEVPEGCLINCQNVLPSLSVGGVSLINGYTAQNPNSQIEESSVGVPVNGLISFYNQNGNTEFFVSQAGSDLWNNSPEGTWSKITGSLSITSSQNNLASMTTLNNILYGVNRSEDQLWQWPLTGNATPVPIAGLYSVSVVAGGQNYVVGDVLTIGGGTGGTVTVTGVQDVGSLTGVIDAVSITTVGSGYVVSPGVSPTGGTGTGASLSIDDVTPQINGNFLVNFNNTLFVNAGSSLPTALYYSDLNLGNSFNPINFLLFNTGQGTYLTGAVNGLFGNLIVFKNKSIHIVSPTGSVPSYSNFLYVDGIGCVSHQSIVTLPGGTVMWWDTDDIYMLVGNQVLSATNHPKTRGSRLRNFFRNNVNSNRLKYVCGCYYPALDCVFWFYSSPSSNSNDQCIAYHVKTQSYWLLSLRATSCAVRVIQNESQLFTGDITGFIFQQDNGGTFNGSQIPWNFQIPWQDFGDLTMRKKGDLVYSVIQQPTTFNMLCDFYINQQPSAYSTNNILQTIGIGGSPSVFDTAKFDTATFSQANTQLMEASCLINTLFKSLSLYFHGSNSSQPFTVHRVSVSTRSLEFSRLTD